jgi:protein-tyrosine phosphatase
MAASPFVINTVCLGNICRSPMAAAVLREHLDQAGLLDRVTVSSSGISAEEQGNRIDRRAERALLDRGYPVDASHRAHRITASEIKAAGLILPATHHHYRYLERQGAGRQQLRMLLQFDPKYAGQPASPALDLEDPWYGTAADFETVLDQIEAATPGLVEYVRGRLD